MCKHSRMPNGNFLCFREAMNRLKAVGMVGAFTLLLTILIVLNVGHWLSAPRTVPTEGDIIVALGGGAPRLTHPTKFFSDYTRASDGKIRSALSRSIARRSALLKR